MKVHWRYDPDVQELIYPCPFCFEPLHIGVTESVAIGQQFETRCTACVTSQLLTIHDIARR
jgi:hypothetical protein